MNDRIINIFTTIVDLIIQHNLYSDDISHEAFLKNEGQAEELKKHLDYDIYMLKEATLNLDFLYLGNVINGDKSRGYTLIKISIENALFSMHFEKGQNKFNPNQILKYNYSWKTKREQQSKSEINLITEKILETLNVNKDNKAVFKDFCKATVLFEIPYEIIPVDENIINGLSYLLSSHIMPNIEMSNKEYLYLAEFEKVLDKLPVYNIDTDDYMLHIKYWDATTVTIRLDSTEGFILDEFFHDGEYRNTPYKIHYPLLGYEESSDADHDEVAWFRTKENIECHPERVDVYFEYPESMIEVANEWKIGKNGYLELEDKFGVGEKSGYIGKMKVDGIEAKVEGRLDKINSRYRFDFTFVGVRDFKPISGAGSFLRSREAKYEYEPFKEIQSEEYRLQLKVHGEESSIFIVK
jgi:hypothetical protein